jgi:hypothetical protein
VSPSTEPTETPTAPATEAPTTGSPDEAPTTGSTDQDQPPAQPDQGIAPPAEQGQNQGSDGNAE